MSPSALRVTILIVELMVFFIVTVFMSDFISNAGAVRYGEKDAPPPQFPVIAYDGNREHPEAKGYLVVPWSEWEALAAKRPGASLLLPQSVGSIRIGESKATFTASSEGEGRQAVKLTWTGNTGEQQVLYSAQARAISPRYFRSVTANTLLLAAAIGFISGLLAGRAMRRRFLAQPGYFAPPQAK